MKKQLLILLFIVLLQSVLIQILNAQNGVIETSATSTTGTLTIAVTTSSNGGIYAPRNIEAIWIQDNSGKFVKTLLVNAGTRIRYLTNWNTSSGGNIIDAISGATQSTHGVRTATWNGTNAAATRAVVQDGTYKILMELTDINGTGNLNNFSFTKGPNSQVITPLSVPSFSNITISWSPTFTGFEEVTLSKLYNVYPNPTTSFVYLNGPDIQQIELFTFMGKSVLKTTEPKINLSLFPNGIYLAKLITKSGIFVKKIEKK